MVERVEGNLRGVIWSDCEEYYAYLPGMFIVKDVHKIPPGSIGAYNNEKGEMVLKPTYGVALFEMPFFLAARPVARVRLSDPDDYTREPYGMAVALAGYFCAFLGLFFLRKALLRRHSPWAVFWTLLAVFAGTNLYHYATKEMGMSHVYSFCLFAFLVWHTPRFFEKPDWKNAALLGGALGWTLLIRSTNTLALLFVLLYDVYSWAALKERLRFFRRQWRALLVAMAACFLFFIPQMWYWYEMTGKLILQTGEEGFKYWNRPKLAAVLFDPQNGLFLYSPMVLVMLFGVGMGWRNKTGQAPALTLIFVLATYFFASWRAWWYGGAFGHRAFIDLYPLLALPLAGVFETILSWRRSWIKISVLAVFACLVLYSVAMSRVYTLIGGPWDGQDWSWNWSKMAMLWEKLF